jgi:hypothetical protein
LALKTPQLHFFTLTRTRRSRWHDKLRDGLFPFWEAFTLDSDKDNFLQYCSLLMGPQWLETLSNKNVAGILGAVLVMHYPNVKEEFPSSIVIQHMKSFPRVVTELQIQ